MPSRDNLTVQNISVGSTAPTAVVFPTRYNIFNVTAPLVGGDVSPFNWIVNLPDDSDTAVGDVAEFHVNRSYASSSAGTLTVTDSAGTPFYPAGADLSINYPYWTLVIRKTAANTWRATGKA